jgi:hypothetical protein
MKFRIGFIVLFIPVLFACDQLEEISSIQSKSFIKYYGANPVNQGTDVAPIVGGGYALLGNTETEFLGTYITLTITDEFGNSIQPSTPIGSSGNDRGYCIKSAPGGGFIILGSTRDTLSGKLDALLIRTDDSGGTLWTKTFDGDKLDDEGYYFDFNRNNEIIMTGYATYRDKGKEIWLKAVNLEGDTLNYFPRRRFGGVYEDEGRYLQIMDDGIVITGKTRSYPGASATSPFHSFIITTPLDGSTSSPLSGNHWGGSTDEEGNCIRMMNDSILLMCGTTHDNTAGGSDVVLHRFQKTFTDNTYYFKHDAAWNYGGSGDDYGTSLLVQDNKICLLSTFSTGASSSVITIITMNLDGLNPVMKQIGGSSLMAGQTFSGTEDGGFIISGTNRQNDNSSITLIKTKPGGNL